jgi:hypothetical protein
MVCNVKYNITHSKNTTLLFHIFTVFLCRKVVYEVVPCRLNTELSPFKALLTAISKLLAVF